MKSALENLFESQIRDWPLLARGIEGLAGAATRQVRIDGFDVFVRHIPHRLVSVTARVDRASVEKRPCFLCIENMPKEEKGIAIGDYALFCNPFPILERHLSVIHREHRPQLIAGQLEALLELAEVLPDHFLLYNGPECGASAPDHLHFQACSRRLFPIQRDAARQTGVHIPGYVRNVIVLRGSSKPDLAARLAGAVDILGSVTGKSPEPMINIAAFHESGEWTVYVFPRGKHRPSVFHSGELIVSPGAIDLCGVVVVPVERDYERITGEDIADIFREVTLADPEFNEVLEQLQ